MKQIAESLDPREQSALCEKPRTDAPNRVITVVTWSPDARPHAAQIGPAEVDVVDERQVVLALWPGTTTAERARPGQPLMLIFQVDNAFVTVHLTVTEREDLVDQECVGVAAAVDQVVIDEVDYAHLTSSSQFLVRDAAVTAERWQLHMSALHHMKERSRP